METRPGDLAGQGMSLATIFVVLGSILYSTKSLFVKQMMVDDVDSGEILAMRLLWAAPLYLAVVGYQLVRRRQNPWDLLRMMALGMWGFWLAPRLNFAGLGRTSAGLERILIQSSTAFVILFVAISVRKPPRRPVVVAVVSCYAGLVLALAGKDEGRPFADLGGVGLILLAAATWALFVVGVGRMQKRLGSVLATSLGMVGALVPAFVESAIVGDPTALARPSAHLVAPLAGLVVVGTIVPSFLAQAGLARVGPVRASILSLVGPAVLPFMASAVLHESMPIHQMAGLSVVLASCALMALRS